MKIAFVSPNDSFSGHIIEELRQHHTVKVWVDYPDQYISRTSLALLLDWCDLAYLEWLQPPNLEISHFQGLEKPLVAFCHGFDVMNHRYVGWNNLSGLIVQHSILPRLEGLRNSWQKEHPDKKLSKLPRTLVQNLGVDLKTFTPPPQVTPEYHIVTHSTIIRPTKRIYTAIQQFYDLLRLDSDKPWKFTVVGLWTRGWKGWTEEDGYDYSVALRELIDQLDFPKERLFVKHDNFPRPVWAQFLKTADIYWTLSWRESFGISMAEACATGVYPLVNHYLGADCVYPDKYLCKTPGEMVDKTIQWGNLTDDEKLHERQKIRKYISQYDAGKAAEKIRLFLEEIKEEYRK